MFLLICLFLKFYGYYSIYIQNGFAYPFVFRLSAEILYSDNILRHLLFRHLSLILTISGIVILLYYLQRKYPFLDISIDKIISNIFVQFVIVSIFTCLILF